MIALDVMGGDHAPQAIVHGALLAAQESISITLFGPHDLITSLLEKLDVHWKRYPLYIAHADQVIGMDDDPVLAVKTMPDSSLVQAVASVKNGTCQAVISAGSSGALMVASTLILGRQEGVGRAAIAGFLPTKKGKVLALDLGANTEVRPEHLYQFAHLGATYVAAVSGIKRPRVALLANGHEEGKGSALVKQAHALLKKSTLNFIGNAEPHHVFNHEMDVIVCDGFTGNVLLKTSEAVTDMFSSWLAQGIADYSNSQVRTLRVDSSSLSGLDTRVALLTAIGVEASRYDREEDHSGQLESSEALSLRKLQQPSVMGGREQLMDEMDARQVRAIGDFIQTSIDARLDYKGVGGALLLGVNGTVVVCHGSSDAQTIQRAITFAWGILTPGVNIQKEIIKTVQL